MRLNKLTAGAAAFAVSFGVMAADSGMSGRQAQGGNVNYVSGGVGEDEAAALQSEARNYPLELQFVQKAQPRDEFLADVKVRITDHARNVVLDTTATGPFLLAKLPPGRYQVEADYSGVVKRRTVDLNAGKHQKAVFVWAPTDETRQSMADQPDSPTSALR